MLLIPLGQRGQAQAFEKGSIVVNITRAMEAFFTAFFQSLRDLQGMSVKSLDDLLEFIKEDITSTNTFKTRRCTAVCKRLH